MADSMRLHLSTASPAACAWAPLVEEAERGKRCGRGPEIPRCCHQYWCGCCDAVLSISDGTPRNEKAEGGFPTRQYGVGGELWTVLGVRVVSTVVRV